MKKILLSCVTCLLALGLVTACDDEVEDVTPNEPETTVPSEDTGDGKGGDTGETTPGGSEEEGAGTTLQYVEVEELVDGESYYLGFPDTTSGSMYLFNGTTDSSAYYLQCSVAGTEDFEPVEVKVSITEADSDDQDSVETIGLTFTGTSGVENTIYAWPSSNSQYGEITFIETSLLEDTESGPKEGAVTDFTWDADRGTLDVKLNNGDWYLETYADKSAISLASTDKTYAASHFYSVVEIPNPTAVTVSAEETSVKVGSTLQLTATIEPEGAYADMTWSSSDNSVAIVSDTGLVKGISEAEEVTITATSTVNPSATGSITIAVTEAEEGDTFEIDVTAQYIVDYFERDNSDGHGDRYGLGVNGGVTDATDTQTDVIGGVTMNFGVFDVEWFNGSGTATKVWTGNQIRIYWATNSGNGNGGGFRTTPHDGWEISSLYVYDTAGKLAGSTLTTISSESESTTLTSGTDYTIESSNKELQTIGTFTTSDTLQFQNTATSSNNMQLTSIKITCTKLGVSA